ncbi:MAG: GNAT family N-acetyltransferase [Maricaulis sp.]|jgi:RimJ/RimL family protein N-acetyltransferase|nr:GNAT family N-acetyltransferase [Maricaulis sp.]HAQ35794.1 GNAT family N-acetyltransferase [Alphaproteobacteria bacterium]
MTGQTGENSHIETERLVLRPLAQDDAQFVARTAAKPEICRMIARVPRRFPVLAAEIFITRTILGERAGRCVVRLITARTDGEPLGIIGIDKAGDGVFDLGYWMAPSAWGQGYVTEAAQAMIAAARMRGIARLTAGNFLDNPASARVLDKLGFTPTGETIELFSFGRMAKAPCRRVAMALA